MSFFHNVTESVKNSYDPWKKNFFRLDNKFPIQCIGDQIIRLCLMTSAILECSTFFMDVGQDSCAHPLGGRCCWRNQDGQARVDCWRANRPTVMPSVLPAVAGLYRLVWYIKCVKSGSFWANPKNGNKVSMVSSILVFMALIG